MTIKVCIAGATGWTGSVVARHLLASDDFDVVGHRPRCVPAGCNPMC